MTLGSNHVISTDERGVLKLTYDLALHEVLQVWQKG